MDSKMTDDVKLAYSANHVYREGYDQAKKDVIEDVKDAIRMHTAYFLTKGMAETFINEVISGLEEERGINE